MFLLDARKKAVAARKILALDEETAYQTAYQAMIKAGLALMLSHGQRPRVQLGHHVAVIEFAERNLAPEHGCPSPTPACTAGFRTGRRAAC